jgi:hypothetical protein
MVMETNHRSVMVMATAMETAMAMETSTSVVREETATGMETRPSRCAETVSSSRVSCVTTATLTTMTVVKVTVSHKILTTTARSPVNRA